MMGCHFQDRPCRASFCLREMCHCEGVPPHLHFCDEAVARSCPHRAWDHRTHLEVCARKFEVMDSCPSCGRRHSSMGDVLRCHLHASIERAFQEGDGGRPVMDAAPLAEGLPEKIWSSAWRIVRGRVVERDGHRCRACGKDLRGVPGWVTEVHHIRPRAEGGSDHPSNLLTLCVMCHKRITAACMLERAPSDGGFVDDPLPRECLEPFR